MSRKIIGVTVGTTLPKPNFKQTDPTKGDYIKNKPDFDGLQGDVEDLKTLVGDTSVSEQISEVMPVKMYIQDDEPEDAPEGALWLDTDAIGAISPVLTNDEINQIVNKGMEAIVNDTY